MKFFYLLLILTFTFHLNTHAHEWTHHVKSSDHKDYYMWVPYVENIKGIIYSSKPNYIISILGDTTIRKMCKNHQIAIVAGKVDSYDAAIEWPYIQNGLEKLANQSNFPEIEHAPICIHGHSAEGLKAIRIASFKPARFFGIIMQNAIVNNDDMTSLNTRIGNIPLLSIRGSEERRVNHVADYPWSATKKGILWMRDSAEKANLIIQPGAGHFIWTTFHAEYVVKWFKNAINSMIPDGSYATNSPINLNNPGEESGWLIECPDTVDLSSLNAMNPLSFEDYVNAGKDPADAIWFFNENLADYWINIHKTEELKTPVSIEYDNPDYCYNNAWETTTYISNYTKTMDISATSSPGGLDVKYTSVYNVFDIEDTILRPSPCKYQIYGGSDWSLAVYDGNEQYRVAEQAHKIKVTSTPPEAAFNYTDISNQQVDDFPVPYSATYNGNNANSIILSGAINQESKNINVEPFYRGISNAEICYSYEQYKMTHNDTFDITWVSGVWEDPQQTTSVRNPGISSKIKVYPVPAEDQIKIEFSELNRAPYKVLIYSGSGKLAFVSDKVNSSSHNINVRGLKTGNYNLCVISGNSRIFNQKIIVR